jgi:O-antigen ligase
MNSQLGFLICGIGVAGLFYLDRDKSVRTSPVLWLPAVYIAIVGSRPVSAWLGGGGGDAPVGNVLAGTLDGSPEDAAIFGMLILAGVFVLLWRKRRSGLILKACIPILIYYSYCLLSTVWSPFPDPAFKRWIKCVGDLVMVLVIVTDPQPGAALRRIFSRIGFLLFPLSVALIKFTNMGVAYDEQGPHYVGVTTNKNGLGLLLFVITTGVVWNIRSLLSNKKASNRRRRLVAQISLLGFGVALLQMAHSATSIFCFLLGSGLMLATGLPVVRKRPAALHVICFGILTLGVGAVFLGGAGAVTGALGRTSDFSGRTEIWAASLASADNQWIGTGFESFWNKNNPKVVRILAREGYAGISMLNSAHDGYLQIYLDLGLIGLSLLALILCNGYLWAVRAFRLDRDIGGLFLAYIVTCSFYSITESGFRIMTLSWIFLLLAVAGSASVIVGVTRPKKPEKRVFRAHAETGKTPVRKADTAASAFRMVARRRVGWEPFSQASRGFR